ncbi:MAG: hypothetical protein JRF72_12680 [Deltaproteobacteria bacterium]|nr:hypothetical protein [Deltaproteobacteria bacterium]
MKSQNIAHRYVSCLIGVMLGFCLACSSFATAPQKVPTALEMARENLLISQATEKRIAYELEQLKKSGKASPEVIQDYEIYLDRVQAMVAENLRIVNEMEATYARYVPEKSASASTSSDEKDKMLDPEIPEQQTVDELAALDRELEQSLSEFDTMLLKELDLIRAKSSERMQDLAHEAAEAARRLKEKGIDLEGSSSGESEESESAEGAEGEEGAEGDEMAEKGQGDTQTGEGASGQQGKADDQTGTGDERAAKDDGSTESGKGKGRDRYGSGEDDDIVARQLREAAEKETDPELKEKLWQEYEEYKKNTGN